MARVSSFLEICERNNALADGHKLLEIGTGWVHWESLAARLFFDVDATLFDVWENRQLGPLKKYSKELGEQLPGAMDLTDEQKRRIAGILAGVEKARDYDELYGLLNFNYVVDPAGVLQKLPDNTYDLLYSRTVLEHVDRDAVEPLSKDFCRVLKPGGYSIHSIDLGDHLVFFSRVRNMCRKQYLAYPETTWKGRYENKVQYINRVQRPEWLRQFTNAGLELVEEQTIGCSVDDIEIDPMFQHLEKDDLECRSLRVVHRKPLVDENATTEG